MKTHYVVTTTILVVILAFSQASPLSFRHVSAEPTTPVEDPALLLAFDGMRGFSLGFSSGLYKSEKTEDCLTNETIHTLQKTIRAISEKEFSNVGLVFQLFGEMMSIYQNHESCSFNSFYEVINYCKDNFGTECGPGPMALKAQKNLFILMGKLTDIQQIMMVFPGSTSAEIYEQSYQIGDAVGTMVRVLTGFK